MSTIGLLAQVTTVQEAVETPEVVWSLMWPVVILAIGGILLVTLTSLVPRLRGGGFPSAFTGGVAALAGATLVPIWSRVNDTEGPQLLIGDAIGIDSFTVFVTAVICIAVFFAAMLLDEYLRREGLDGPEWYVLLLMSASGGVLLASAEDLIMTFLGLEILSIAAYVLAALHLRRTDSQEAGFKYFLLGAVSSALFLYGIALVYGATGSTSLRAIAAARANGPGGTGLNPTEESSLILVGMALLLVGFAFKVSAVPFHTWTPDVYEGAPTPVVAFMASGVKVAGFAGMVRVFWVGLSPYALDWRPLIAGLAVLTMLVGSILALAQTNVKRMLAYSSITHAGFMLVAVHAAANPASDGMLGGEALLFYLLAYTIMVAGTFGVVTIVGGRGDGRHHVEDYRGLSRRAPVLAGLMSVLLFAQAGVPFTSGFFAKFRVIAAAARDESYLLAGIAMVSAVIAAVLYLRVVVSMFLIEGAEEVVVEDDGQAPADGIAVLADGEAEAADSDAQIEEASLPVVSPALSAFVAVGVAAVATIVLGVLPNLGGGVLNDAAETLSAFRN